MKSFLDACRLEEPLQLIVEAGGESDVGVRVLHQPFALIGRDPRADVPLEHRLVSRRHAYLQVVEGVAFWIDLESRLGTLCDGRPRKYGWLTRRDVMRIGPYAIRLGGSLESDALPPDAIPLVSRAYGSTPWPEVGLEFLNGPSRSAVWPMNRVVSLVGSAAGCKFRLADPSVSQFHCSLVRTSVGVWVVDLLGGGVEVNNAAVRYALLSDGDILAIGRYRIRIQSRMALESPTTIGKWNSTGSVASGRSLAVATSPSTFGATGVPARRDVDATPLVPTVSVIPTEIEIAPGADAANVLVPLMNQFGLMQQQMMDQFQNAMGMLVEMFGSLQREQMDLIRQELDQLREVTREVQELKSELASFTQARDSAAVAVPDPIATASETPSSQEPESGPDSSSSVSEGPREAVVPPSPQPSPCEPTVAAMGPDAAAALKSGASPRGPGRPGARHRPERPSSAADADEADVMLWLNNRISTLQQERESRWQKILKLLPGGSS